MEILVVTTFFPNSIERQRTVFVENLVRALSRLCPVNVVAPVPYAPPIRWAPDWYAQSRIPRDEDIGGIRVVHPRFVVIPKLEWLSGLGYFFGILATLRHARKSSGHLVIHAHCAYPDGVGVALAARVLGLPYVITTHGSDINVYAERRALRAQIRWALGSAAGVIAVSRDLQKKIGNLLVGCATPVEYIPCAGYDPDLFIARQPHATREKLGVNPSGRLVVFIGKLVPIKGVDILIDAWARLSRNGTVTEIDKLIIIGEGKCRAALEHQASVAGIGSALIFLGAIPHSTVSEWLAAADTLCLPSYNEGTPNVIVEALVCGVSVVATRVGGVPEIVSDGVNGLLVSPGNPEALAQAIQDAFSRVWDREAMRHSVRHLTWDALAERNYRFVHDATRGAINDSLV